jgi:UDPglucose 6-dehydrogenase
MPAETKIGIYGLGNIGTALKELLECHWDLKVSGYDPRVEASDTIEEVNDSDVIWICVDTPTAAWGDRIDDQPGDYDYTNLKAVLQNIDTGVPVIVGCTVSPGTCRKLEYSGDLFYMPFLISQGDIKSGLISPDCWFIGTDGETNPRIVELLLTRFSKSKTNVGTYEEAELAKVLYNSWIIQKINFANWAGDLAYRLENANSQRIMAWLKASDKLITSNSYMTPGWGDGGPCHPRDNLMMSWLSRQLGLSYDPAWNNHRQRIEQAKALAKRAVGFDLPIIILGRSYKAGVDSDVGSYSLLVAEFIKQLGGTVYFEDYTTPGDYCYILAHNNWYGHIPSTTSKFINLWKE